VQTACRTRI